MIGKMIFSIEAFATDIAGKGTGFAVYEVVTSKFKFRIEPFIAELTGEGQFAGVGEDMLAKFSWAGEPFVTGGASVALGLVTVAARAP